MPLNLPPAGLLQAWRHTATKPSSALVLPDGCCDLIVHSAVHQTPRWFVTSLADGPHTVQSAGGERYQGYRFLPGARIDIAGLLQVMRQSPHVNDAGCDDADVLPWIDAFVSVDVRVADALSSLADAPTIGCATRRLGVSERSLERLMTKATGRSPGFWKSLARVRRAARALSDPVPLAAIAADHGFSDQAHLSRECRRWLGLSPSQLRQTPDVLAVLAESGYG